MAFFEKASELELVHSKISLLAQLVEHPRMQVKILNKITSRCKNTSCHDLGKSWLLHVTDVLRTTPEENLAMIEDSVRYLNEQGKEVIYDAEHFFDGYLDNPNMLCLPFLPRKRAERTLLSSAKQMVANCPPGQIDYQSCS